MNQRSRLFSFACIALLGLAAPALGQGDNPFETGLPGKPKQLGSERIKVRAELDPARARRGENITLKVILDIQPGFHTYPTKQSDKNASGTVTLIKIDSEQLALVGDWKNPPALTKPEPALNILKLEYYEGLTTIEGTLRVKPDAKPGKHDFTLTVSGQVCDEKGCVPFRDSPALSLTISDEATVATAPRTASTAGPSSAAPPTAASDDGQADQKGGLWTFILAGIIAGYVSVITPCVFPMIPITVSYFLKQSEQEHHRPILFASVYTGTIIVVLSLGAIFLLGTFKFLSLHWITNVLIGGLFIFFALSLFGMYEIELPSGLARFTSAREGRGGLIGTVFMALTFTIVSFACVAPFMGAFAGLFAQTHAWYELLLGGLAYATAFASPFFVLALFPSMLRTLPKSGSWLNTVKVVMGFLEIAAAIKFLRAGELLFDGEANFLTFELALGLYVALGMLCGLYLLNLFRLPHDTPTEHLGVPRMLFSLVFLALSFYLLPGLTLQRPNGKIFAWLESFLLPDTGHETALALGGGRATPASASAEIVWRGNMADALKVAGESEPKKLVFIDFTGVG